MAMEMTSLHSVLPEHGLLAFRDIDALDDPGAYIAFLDAFAGSFSRMIDTGIELCRLRPGNAILDMGCGHGAAFEKLAAIVGAGGRIAGLDRSRALLAEAQRRISAIQCPIELQAGDAHELPFADAAFDAARADRVLTFVRDAHAALDELVRVTRVGGRIVVCDADFDTATVDASDVQTTRTVLAARTDEASNGWMGRQLRAMFVDRGLREVEVRLFTLQSTSFAEWRSLGIESAVRRAIDAGQLSQPAASAWLAELAERDACGRFFATGMFFQVAGTV
jgi:ubiquinone/menaquinone biosynthesis C-methylase UbiE